MSAQKTKCSTDDNTLYSEQLKKKITNQAKRLTKLANEKEELLELLREKTMTIDTSFSSNIYPTKNKHYYERELILANEKIRELEKNKNDLNKFKDTISKRLSLANEDIEKTKIALNDIQKEKEDLLNQIKNLNDEKLGFLDKISTLEEKNTNLMKTNNELENEKKQLILHQTEITKTYDSQIAALTEKNKKLFQDNKDLVIQVKKTSKIISNLKKENDTLKTSNMTFSQKIDNLTMTLSTFQNDINKTLRQSTTLEIQAKNKEFLSIISSKDLEISKLKELNNNYIMLEQELSKSLKEKTQQASQYKMKLDSFNNDQSSLQREIEQLKIENEKIIEENIQLKQEVNKFMKNYENATSQFQSSSNLKNTQINNLKNYVELLEDKTVTMGKNKKYLEHLLIYTHPKSEKVKQILEIYKEIINLEIQKKNFEKEYIISQKGNEDENNKMVKQQAIDNIDEQIKMLKQSLKEMEDDIRIDKEHRYLD